LLVSLLASYPAHITGNLQRGFHVVGEQLIRHSKSVRNLKGNNTQLKLFTHLYIWSIIQLKRNTI